MQDKILILDFGGQYCQLIARRVREEGVFAEVRAFNKIDVEEIRLGAYTGVILTGGPNSVYDEASPHFSPALLTLGIPVLGICYGHQLLTYMAGGEVASAESGSEYGKTKVHFRPSPLFEGVPAEADLWMSHTDYVRRLPEGFTEIAFTDKCPHAAISDESRSLYGVQFHPEVTHSAFGREILQNFLFSVCHCEKTWKMEDFTTESIEKYRRSLAGKKVLCGLSGGVDSAVCSVLLHKAIGDNLTCVFVDHGLLRLGEAETVMEVFGKNFGMNVILVDAKKRFLERLKGVTEPEQKRKIIGEEFIRVFEETARKIGNSDALAQGTIYPDVIESGTVSGKPIKSHHNVGGLPERMAFSEIVEPLRPLFKDEVRRVGLALGIPESLVFRQPFPGPGLAVRIIGEITEEKADILRHADAIFREEIDKLPLDKRPNQYFAVLTDTKSVGVIGDARTYGYTVALRSVDTDDFMTAGFTRLSYELLEKASSRITGEVPHVNRVVYDITSKPPATVEWE